jgi:hypothetical protein
MPKRTVRAAIRSGESEEHFERRLLTLARVLGWRGYHTRKSFGAVMGVSPLDGFGWPDWCFWHPKKRRFLVRELKAERGRLSGYQTVVLAELAWCGVDAKVWRPSDWTEIEETFAA